MSAIGVIIFFNSVIYLIVLGCQGPDRVFPGSYLLIKELKQNPTSICIWNKRNVFDGLYMEEIFLVVLCIAQLRWVSRIERALPRVASMCLTSEGKETRLSSALFE